MRHGKCSSRQRRNTADPAAVRALRKVALGDHTERYEQSTELLARLLLRSQRTLQSGGIELAALDQNVGESFAYWCVLIRCAKFDEMMIA